MANKMTETSAPSGGRNTIVGIEDAGLRVSVGERAELRSWSTIDNITVALVPSGDASIFVLAVGFHDGRVLVLGEVEPAWRKVAEPLHLYLPGVEPFAEWGPRLVQNPGVVMLYGSDE